MKWYRHLTIMSGIVALVVGGGVLAHAKAELGKPAPDFELKDDAGKTYKLSDFKGKRVVVEFWNHGCPWVQGTEKDRNANVEKYREKGVVFLSLDPNVGNTAEGRKAYMEKSGSKYPVLVDEGNKVADAYDAKQTPEVYVIGEDGMLAYHGAFDNRNRPATTGDVNNIANALDALAKGEAVSPQTTKAFGCGIKRAGK